MRGGRQAHGVTTKANGQGATAQPTEQQLGQELRFEERTEGVASGTRIRFQARGSPLMNSFLGEWREGKVRPIQGNAPHDRPVSRGMISPKGIYDDSFVTTRFPQLSKNYNFRAPDMRF